MRLVTNADVAHPVAIIIAKKMPSKHGTGEQMRTIDADELQEEYKKQHDGKRSLLIDVAPTVEPQRMRGKWNAYYHGEENGKSIFSYSCNQCGYGAPYNFIGGVCEQKKWNFCPNCGAKMEGTE